MDNVSLIGEICIPTSSVYFESWQARHSHDCGIVDCCVESIHGEGRRAVADFVPRVQAAPHDQVDELVRATTHLQCRVDLRQKSLSSRGCIRHSS